MKKSFFLSILFVFFGIKDLAANQFEKTPSFGIEKLKVEFVEEPLGIDVEKPRFSWNMKSDNVGARQKAYQIVVTSEEMKVVWNSGKVKSDMSLNIQYEGSPLKPQTRYYWKVFVWNEKNKKNTAESWFETGLMNSGLSAWKDAKWIGCSDDDLVLYSHYLPVFRIDYELELDEERKSTRAGFIYGANDNRLMNKNMNIFQLESKRDESYLMLEVDIAPMLSGQDAILNVYRVGFHPDDLKDKPFKSVSIPSSVINKNNKYQKHRISFTNNLGHTAIVINQKEIIRLGLNPLGQGGDFIAFPVLGDIGFYVPENQKAVFSNIEIRNYRNPSNLIVKEKGSVIVSDDTSIFATHNPSRNSMPILRTRFETGSTISKARLYVTSRGIYDFYINGKLVNKDYFNPGSTQYNKTHLYRTFDVTDLLRSGENAMGAVLGEGWWSGGATFMGEYWNFFGDRQSLLAKLVITYTDGREDVIVTHPDSWKYYNDGPLIYGSFFQGEVYDATKEAKVLNWSKSSYDDLSWKRATEVPLEGTSSFKAGEFNDLKLIGQSSPPVKAIMELTAQSVEEVRPGVFVYDMGQNMVGVPGIKLTNVEPGQRITLRFAEMKYPDLPEYGNNVGTILLENIRAAMSHEIYTAKGENDMIQPRFTFHGYRFIEITGIDVPLPLESVKGIVLSSVHELASYYVTSNKKVNKLWENITWSTYGNFLSIPTDCPQRNERLGWGGDISVFARASTYLADVSGFLRQHMQAIRDTQQKNGRFPDIAPMDVGFGGILWGSAGITVPWELYQQYNDIDLLSEHYDAMKHYIHYILNETIDKETGVIVQQRAWGDLADWLSPEDGKNDKSLLWEAYFLYDLAIMKKTATILGKMEDVEWFTNIFDHRKDFFNNTYIQKESGKTIFSSFDKERRGRLIDTQTSYVLPLVFDLLNEEDKQKIIANLVETIIRDRKADDGKTYPPYSLMTGFIGTSWINKALSDNGHSDIAYRLLQQTSYPSWLYSVEQGATTIWERLNSYSNTNGFGGNNQMNSFNHYSFGAVASWMYNHSLGIERDENSPGFKHFFLKPEVDSSGEMTFAGGYYDSMYGRIESAWEQKDGKIFYSFSVPPNTSAHLFLDAATETSIKSEGKPFRAIKGVKYWGVKDGKHIFKLESGKYNVEILIKKQ